MDKVNKITKKQPKGTVGIESFHGRLRLRLPRQVTAGNRYLTLGLADTRENRKIALAKAKLIEADIILERFDPSLNKYRPPNYKPATEDLTLVELWEQYTEAKAEVLSLTTINTDFRKVKNHIQSLPSKQLSEASKIRKFLIEKLSPDAARRVLMQLRACCQWALDEELISTNPFSQLPRVQVIKNKSINPFSKEERDMIIRAFEGNPTYFYYTPFVKFLFWTGCRTSEAVGLTWKHIDPTLKFITFSEAVVGKIRKDTKTHSVRKFPTNQALKNLLADLRPDTPAPDAPVFVSKEGLPIDAHNFLNRAWHGVVEKLAIKYRPQYNTRHTFITLCLEEGVPVTQVAAWVGNSPKTIWSHYAGLVNLSSVPEP
jgi:integrase